MILTLEKNVSKDSLISLLKDKVSEAFEAKR